MKSRLLILLASLASVAAAQTPPADIARCTAIDTDAERLACYDKLFVRSADQPKKEAKAAVNHKRKPRSPPPLRLQKRPLPQPAPTSMTSDWTDENLPAKRSA